MYKYKLLALASPPLITSLTCKLWHMPCNKGTIQKEKKDIISIYIFIYKMTKAVNKKTF